MNRSKLISLIWSIAFLIPSQSQSKEGWEHVFANHDLIGLIVANIPVELRLQAIDALRDTSSEIRRVVDQDRRLDPHFFDRYHQRTWPYVISLIEQVPKEFRLEFHAEAQSLYGKLCHLKNADLTPAELRRVLMAFTTKLSAPFDSGLRADQLESLDNVDFTSFALMPKVLEQPRILDYGNVHQWALVAFLWCTVIGVISGIWAFVEVAQGNYEHRLAAILIPLCLALGPSVLIELGHLIFFASRLFLYKARSIRADRYNLGIIESRHRWLNQFAMQLGLLDELPNPHDLRQLYPQGSQALVALRAYLTYLQISTKRLG